MLGHSIKNQKGDLWKIYIRTNTKDINSIETGRIVIAHFFSWSDQENCCTSTFLLPLKKLYRYCFKYKND